MNLKLTNTSQYTGRKGDTHWWRWTAFIVSSDPDDLNDIEYVEYRLHPSFKNPIKWVKRKEGGFPITMLGWGTFELVAKVVFTDSRKKPILLKHYLNFENDTI